MVPIERPKGPPAPQRPDPTPMSPLPAWLQSAKIILPGRWMHRLETSDASAPWWLGGIAVCAVVWFAAHMVWAHSAGHAFHTVVWLDSVGLALVALCFAWFWLTQHKLAH